MDISEPFNIRVGQLCILCICQECMHLVWLLEILKPFFMVNFGILLVRSYKKCFIKIGSLLCRPRTLGSLSSQFHMDQWLHYWIWILSFVWSYTSHRAQCGVTTNHSTCCGCFFYDYHISFRLFALSSSSMPMLCLKDP